MLQEFISNDFDVRVVCFDGRPQLVIKRQRTSDGTHLNNTSQGAEATLLELSGLPESVLAEVPKICDAFGRQMAGVDYIVANDGTSRYICLEVNAVPQLTSGSFTQEKRLRLGDAIKEALE
jgi:glutathione synthase/RimK-type ligase-like ATP-grasp enzyme